eukprot:1162016-Pelagomonas_calceolata.AAC.8
MLDARQQQGCMRVVVEACWTTSMIHLLTFAKDLSIPFSTFTSITRLHSFERANARYEALWEFFVKPVKW